MDLRPPHATGIVGPRGSGQESGTDPAVTDHFDTVSYCQIIPVETGRDFRALIVKSSQIRRTKDRQIRSRWSGSEPEEAVSLPELSYGRERRTTAAVEIPLPSQSFFRYVISRPRGYDVSSSMAFSKESPPICTRKSMLLPLRLWSSGAAEASSVQTQ